MTDYSKERGTKDGKIRREQVIRSQASGQRDSRTCVKIGWGCGFLFETGGFRRSGQELSRYLAYRLHSDSVWSWPGLAGLGERGYLPRFTHKTSLVEVDQPKGGGDLCCMCNRSIASCINECTVSVHIKRAIAVPTKERAWMKHISTPCSTLQLETICKNISWLSGMCAFSFFLSRDRRHAMPDAR